MSQPSADQVPTGGAAAAAAAVRDPSDGGRPQSAGRPNAAGLPTTGDVVLDAPFVIALLRRDPTASALAHVLPRAVMTSVTAGEVYVALAATEADPQRIEGVLRALGVRFVDLPLAATHHFPALHRVDAAWRAEMKAFGNIASELSLSDLCVLGYSLAANLPVLTGNPGWAPLCDRGIAVKMYTYGDS